MPGVGSFYYHYDGSGNVVQLTDAVTQATVARYDYDAFGNLLAWSGPQTVQPYRFSSKAQHSNSGLIDFGFRFYSPELGRFLNRDPIGEAGGINLYGFVDNSSVNYIDPDGAAKIKLPFVKVPDLYSLARHPLAQRGQDAVGRGLGAIGRGIGRAWDGVKGLTGRCGGQIGQRAAQCTPTLPFKSGDFIVKELNSSKGVMEVGAEALIEGGGKILHLREIMVYPRGAPHFPLGTREAVSLGKELAKYAKDLGFETLRITGHRTGGINPGRPVDLTITLR